MKIAFYAPMKPPDHAVPSGDRTMARLLVGALEHAGHEVELACRLRSRDPQGDPARQARLRDLGGRLAQGYLRRCRRSGWRPDLWFTYHLYYKAPDWVGPAVARALDIPYVAAEASVAHKRANGPWDASYRAVLAALEQAAAILPLNPKNAACLPHPDKHRALPPFLEIPGEPSDEERLAIDLARHGGPPALIAVGMMRDGAKLASYRLLSEALARLTPRQWTLDIVGYGPAEPEVRAAFAPFAERVRWHGVLSPDELLRRLRASDLFVWPAVEEAYGMAILEAMAAGLPVVAGDEGGVSALVADGETGLLANPRDSEDFAACVAQLLDDPELRTRYGRAARAKAKREHSLAAASTTLDAIVREAAAP